MPFVAHTCLKSNHTDFSFLGSKAFCHHSDKNNCHKQKVVLIEKDNNCCKSYTGTIEAEANLVVSNIAQFQAVISILPTVQIFKEIDKYCYSPNNNYSDDVALAQSQVPLQIMQQSFLC